MIRGMSAFGTKRTFQHGQPMSALRDKADVGASGFREGGTMRSRRSFLHLGLVAAPTLVVSSASAAPAYHGSARGGGTVTARDDAARNFTAVREHRAWTYHVTDKTRFVVDGTEGSWWDVRLGTVVQVRWHRAGSQRVADIVGIGARRN
jgi:hypothetical protein